jgi:hypothetical protein
MKLCTLLIYRAMFDKAVLERLLESSDNGIDNGCHWRCRENSRTLQLWVKMYDIKSDELKSDGDRLGKMPDAMLVMSWYRQW